MDRIVQLFKEHISFGTPRAITLNLLGILLVAAIVPFERVHLLPVRSVWTEVFGITVWSTGLTRATVLFMHGDIRQAVTMNWLVVVVMVTFLSLIAVNAKRWSCGRV